MHCICHFRSSLFSLHSPARPPPHKACPKSTLSVGAKYVPYSCDTIAPLHIPQKEPLKALLYFALFLLRLGQLLRGFLVYCAVDYAVVKYAVNVSMYAAYTYAKAAAVRGYYIEG